MRSYQKVAVIHPQGNACSALELDREQHLGSGETGSTSSKRIQHQHFVVVNKEEETAALILPNAEKQLGLTEVEDEVEVEGQLFEPRRKLGKTLK